MGWGGTARAGTARPTLSRAPAVSDATIRLSFISCSSLPRWHDHRGVRRGCAARPPYCPAALTGVNFIASTITLGELQTIPYARRRGRPVSCPLGGAMKAAKSVEQSAGPPDPGLARGLDELVGCLRALKL